MTTWSDAFSTRPNVSYSVEVYTESQNYAANQSTLRVIVRVYETAQQSSYSFTAANNTWASSVAGSPNSGTYTFDFRPAGLQSYTLLNTTKTVTHDSDGYYTATVTGSSSSSVLGDANIGTRSFFVARIPKAPAAPTPTGIDQITPTSMRYNFTAGNNNGATITDHEVQRSLSNTFSSPTSITGTSTAVTFSGLANHTTYYFRSRSYNSQGWGAWSTTTSAATTGHPTAPLNLVTTPSSSVTGRVALSWDEPATPGAGGIVGYTIYRDAVQIATTTGTGTTYTDNGRTPYTSYSYTVAGRNAYSTSAGGTGPQSSASVAVAPGPPGAPTGLSAVADPLNPGNIDLSWTAPVNVGAGGITGYTVYFSNGTFIANTTGTGTTYTVTGLSPGQTYSFYVRARNALADTEGTFSANSNTATETALGEPGAPASVVATASSVVPGRITVTWTAPAGTLTGYSILDGATNALLGTVSEDVTQFVLDGLTVGVSRGFYIRARNPYTDTLGAGYPGNYGGTASSTASATPTGSSTQTVPSLVAVVDNTNTTFSGTYTITAITSTTFRYTKVASNISVLSAVGGTTTNNTNTTLNGSQVIATPSSTTITYSVTAANIPAAAVVSGTLTNTTNQSFNGSHTITATNVGAKTVTYARVGAVVSSVAVPTNTPPGGRGTITNLTNAVYNGTGLTILDTPDNVTITYSITNADVPESAAAGTATNLTHRDVFNGTYVVDAVLSHNVFTYGLVEDDVEARTILAPYGDAERETSPASLHIKHRPGWAG